jgi:hypothetical protein
MQKVPLRPRVSLRSKKRGPGRQPRARQDSRKAEPLSGATVSLSNRNRAGSSGFQTRLDLHQRARAEFFPKIRNLYRAEGNDTSANVHRHRRRCNCEQSRFCGHLKKWGSSERNSRWQASSLRLRRREDEIKRPIKALPGTVRYGLPT